jgi:purine-cytosine permease-like protein
VVVSQVRINMINAYSGSLSLSNFGARAAGVTPGRHVWMTLLVVISTVLAMTSISDHLLAVLTFEAVFVMGWASTLIACIIYVEPTQARHPDDLREYPDVNPIGTGALAISLAVAVPLAFGVGGELGTALAPLVAMVTGSVAVIACTRLARAWGWAPKVI